MSVDSFNSQLVSNRALDSQTILRQNVDAIPLVDSSIKKFFEEAKEGIIEAALVYRATTENSYQPYNQSLTTVVPGGKWSDFHYAGSISIEPTKDGIKITQVSKKVALNGTGYNINKSSEIAQIPFADLFRTITFKGWRMFDLVHQLGLCPNSTPVQDLVSKRLDAQLQSPSPYRTILRMLLRRLLRSIGGLVSRHLQRKIWKNFLISELQLIKLPLG